MATIKICKIKNQWKFVEADTYHRLAIDLLGDHDTYFCIFIYSSCIDTNDSKTKI